MQHILPAKREVIRPSRGDDSVFFLSKLDCLVPPLWHFRSARQLDGIPHLITQHTHITTDRTNTATTTYKQQQLRTNGIIGMMPACWHWLSVSIRGSHQSSFWSGWW